MLEAALDLLLALCAADGGALAVLCQLGFIPAVLRFALPSNPIGLRHQVRRACCFGWLAGWFRWVDQLVGALVGG